MNTNNLIDPRVLVRIARSDRCRACRSSSRQGARPGRRGHGGENPFFLGDPAEMGAADKKSRRAVTVLYLRGVPAGDFQESLIALLGKDAPNLSPAVIARLTAERQADYDAWKKRTLFGAALRARVGGRRLPAGPNGRQCRMHVCRSARRPHDRLFGQRARVPRVPIALHLAPGPAHRILAHRTAKQGGERTAHRRVLVPAR